MTPVQFASSADDDPDIAGAALFDGGAWLQGTPMDPSATPAEPMNCISGWPFLHPGSGAVIVGPTGGGRSSLMQACLYDAALAGVRAAYLGSEVTEPEFNARAGVLAGHRGDEIDDELRERLAIVRYLNLFSVVTHAWVHPEGWVAGIADAYDVVVIDPLSAVASALDLNFDQSNAEFVKFYDQLVQPVTTKGVTVVMVDNVGHALEARSRAKGASAKSDRADLTFSCSLVRSPPALSIKAHKVRTVRAAFQRGDEWIFYRDSQTIERRETSTGDNDEPFRPTTLMDRVSKLVEAEPSISKREIRKRVSGRNEYVDAAIRILITEGYIEKRTDGHHSLRSFDATTDQDPRAPTVPRKACPPCPKACPHRAPRPKSKRAHVPYRRSRMGTGAPAPPTSAGFTATAPTADENPTNRAAAPSATATWRRQHDGGRHAFPSVVVFEAKPERCTCAAVGVEHREACAAVGVSWDVWHRHIEPDVRLVRIGARKLVPVAEIERWLTDHAETTLERR